MLCQRLLFKASDIIHRNVGEKIYTRLMSSMSTNPAYSSSVDENTFKANLQNIFSEQNKLVVQKRLSSLGSLPRGVNIKEDARSASVLIPLCTVNGVPSLLFMVRPMTMPQHRGEVCFPGGKSDDTDRDLVHTALRESHEEIGLPDDNIDIWGKMCYIPSRKDGNIKVLPVIGVCGEIDLNSLVLNKHEAECVFTRSIESLCSNAHSTQYRSEIGTMKGYTMPVYTGGQYRIWGLTAIFTHQLLSLLIPELYQVKIKHRWRRSED